MEPFEIEEPSAGEKLAGRLSPKKPSVSRSFELLSPSPSCNELLTPMERASTVPRRNSDNIPLVKPVGLDGCASFTTLIDFSGSSRLGSTISKLSSRSVTRSDEEAGGQQLEGGYRSLFISAVANACIGILGAGALAEPAAMSYGGFAMYECVVLAVFILSYVTLSWLIEVADALPPHVHWNYESIAREFWGTESVVVITLAITLASFALTMAAALIIESNLAPLLASNCVLPLRLGQPSCLFGIGLGVVFPLGLLRDITKLKTTSALAVLSLGYAMFYVFVSGVSDIIDSGVSPTFKFFRPSLRIFEGMAMTNSVFSLHNTILPIYRSLGPQRSRKSMVHIVCIAMVVATVFYHGFVYGGYMLFGEQCKGNILENFSKNQRHQGDTKLLVANVAVTLMLIFKIPIVLWAIRSSVLSLARSAYLPADRLLEEPSALEWNSTTFIIMCAILSCAYVFPSIKAIFAIGGSIGGTIIVFIFPAVFHAAVVKRIPPRALFTGTARPLPELSMITIGICLGCLCLGIAIMNALRLKPSGKIVDPFDACNCTSWTKNFKPDCGMNSTKSTVVKA